MALDSKTMNKGSHEGTDVLDEREAQQRRSLIGTALVDKQDRPATQYTTKESATFMSDPTRAVKCALKRLCKHYSEAPVRKKRKREEKGRKRKKQEEKGRRRKKKEDRGRKGRVEEGEGRGERGGERKGRGGEEREEKGGEKRE